MQTKGIRIFYWGLSMFRTLSVSAVLMCAAFSASADNQLREIVDHDLDAMGYEANVFSLNDKAVVELFLALTSSDDEDKALAEVKAVMANHPDAIWRKKGEDAYHSMNLADIRSYVDAWVVSHGLGIDSESLSETEVTEVYLAVTSKSPNAVNLALQLSSN